MKVKKIYLYGMRNALYFQLHSEFKALVEEQTPAALNITQLFAEYLPLYQKMDEAYKNLTKSPQTELIKNADKARDETWAGIIFYIEAYLRHFDPAMREAARRVNIVFEGYGKGKVARMSLGEQTAVTINILQDLESKYLADVTAIGLSPWLVELKARNIALNNLMRDRVNEGSLKVDTAMKEARALLDPKFYEIIEQINARVVVEGAAVYTPFIKKLNIIIAKSLLLMPKRGKKSKKEAVEDETEDTQAQGGSDD